MSKSRALSDLNDAVSKIKRARAGATDLKRLIDRGDAGQASRSSEEIEQYLRRALSDLDDVERNIKSLKD